MKLFRFLLLSLFMLAINSSSFAQCAMCKATADGNPDVGGGLNSGIEYILVVPYILLGTFLFFVLRGKIKLFWKDLTGKDKGSKDDYNPKDWY